MRIVLNGGAGDGCGVEGGGGVLGWGLWNIKGMLPMFEGGKGVEHYTRILVIGTKINKIFVPILKIGVRIATIPVPILKIPAQI